MFLHPFLSGIAASLIGSAPMSQFSLADGCLRFAPALRRFAPCRFRFTPPFFVSKFCENCLSSEDFLIEDEDTDSDLKLSVPRDRNKKNSTSAKSSTGISQPFPDYRGLPDNEQNIASAALQYVEHGLNIAPTSKKSQQIFWWSKKNTIWHNRWKPYLCKFQPLTSEFTQKYRSAKRGMGFGC